MNAVNDTGGKGLVFARPKRVIRLHWFNAVMWLILTVSGLGIVRGNLRFMPQGFAEWMQNLVGGQFNLITGHSLLGLLWAGVFAIFTALNWREIVWPFLKKILSITPRAIITDLTQMVVDMAGLFGLLKKVELPPQGRYNGAQKLLGTMILLSSVVIAATGTIMFLLFLFTPMFVNGAIFRWSLVAHAFFVALVYIGLIAHVYYSLVEEPEVLEGMKSGYLDPGYVAHHCPAWYAELKEQGKV